MLLELMLIDSNVVISAALCQEYMSLGLLVQGASVQHTLKLTWSKQCGKCTLAPA